jgi:L-alanine-DL-glutamate epimerase-like enolase superfamily enzyme
MSSTIRRISWQGFRVPFRSEFATSKARLSARDGLLVFVESGDVLGVGEASFFESDGLPTIDTAAAWVAQLAPDLAGRTPGEAWSALDSVTPKAQVKRTTLCGIETAIADVAVQESGHRLCDWLADTSGMARPSAIKTVSVNGIVQATGTEDAVRDARQQCAAGVTCIKLKVGADPEADAGRVAAVREAVGERIELRADANAAWSVAELQVVARW